MNEHDTVVPPSRRVVGLLSPWVVVLAPGRGGHHGGDNSGRSKWLHVVRGRQSPPICARSVTGEAGENGHSSAAVSDRRARIRPSVASGEIGSLYRIGRSLSTGSPAGRVAMAVSPVEAAAPGSMYSQAAVSRVLSL